MLYMMREIQEGRGEDLRKNLGLCAKKYDFIWQSIVESLCRDFGKKIISERIFEQGLIAFNMIMNASRMPRVL